MRVNEQETIIIRGKKEKVFKEAIALLQRLYPRINESLRTQFIRFEERPDLNAGFCAILYDRDYDETLRGEKTSGTWIDTTKQIFSTGKLWKAVLTIPKWRMKEEDGRRKRRKPNRAKQYGCNSEVHES